MANCAQQDQLNSILNAFKIGARCVEFHQIRNFSLYDIKLRDGTRIKELEKFSDEIALSLHAKSKPLFKPCPDLGVLRMEICHSAATTIDLVSELEKLGKLEGAMPFYLGNASNGQDVIVDFVNNPHLLIGGSSGSGKSTLISTILTNALCRSNIEVDLVDTKGVEFEDFRIYFPNLKIANTYEKAYSLLVELNDDMEIYYKYLREKTDTKDHYRPYRLLIIDELADLMMMDGGGNLYELLLKLSQKSRGAGIHIVLATQRPDANVLKGAIKANFSARIALHCASAANSRIILDEEGAQSLSPRGDAIIKNYNHNSQRFQIAHSSTDRSIYYAYHHQY
jgi:DNA segregation ATPase FtsK/SpoIIIE, S-DNA-T family